MTHPKIYVCLTLKFIFFKNDYSGILSQKLKLLILLLKINIYIRKILKIKLIKTDKIKYKLKDKIKNKY